MSQFLELYEPVNEGFIDSLKSAGKFIWDKLVKIFKAIVNTIVKFVLRLRAFISRIAKFVRNKIRSFSESSTLVTKDNSSEVTITVSLYQESPNFDIDPGSFRVPSSFQTTGIHELGWIGRMRTWERAIFGLFGEGRVFTTELSRFVNDGKFIYDQAFYQIQYWKKTRPNKQTLSMDKVDFILRTTESRMETTRHIIDDLVKIIETRRKNPHINEYEISKTDDPIVRQKKELTASVDKLMIDMDSLYIDQLNEEIKRSTQNLASITKAVSEIKQAS